MYGACVLYCCCMFMFGPVLLLSSTACQHRGRDSLLWWPLRGLSEVAMWCFFARTANVARKYRRARSAPRLLCAADARCTCGACALARTQNAECEGMSVICWV